MDKIAQPQHIRFIITDTPEEILSEQHRIWMNNPPEKRLEMTLSFIESCRQINLVGITNSHSDWNDSEVKKEYFRILYKESFSEAV